MFGTFRLVLALMVMYSHLTRFGYSGQIAVFGFYCLSGYLMTRIVNGPYRDGLGGFSRYLLNRILRIYPAYFLALALALAWILLRSGIHGAEWLAVRWPSILIPNLTLMGPGPRSAMILPHTWSLYIEFVHYIAIGALLGRWRRVSILWAIVAVEIPIFGLLFRADLPAQWYYFQPIGATLPFAIGSLIWHFRVRFARLGGRTALICGGCFIVLGLAVGQNALPQSIGLLVALYATLPLVALVIAALMNLPNASFDDLLGDLAYPVFLIHTIVISVVQTIAGGAGPWVAFFSVTMTLALSWLIVMAVERPLQRFRGRIRGSRSAAIAAVARA